ncbi:hypothetical protein [Aquipuribacter nitratireducens]|uniref:GNAT family N-acetyltransferase n=1 Tax=Aquipuribacter nitratireducens TaxID=650104 RepID=A0ABW0GUB9_9MICO
MSVAALDRDSDVPVDTSPGRSRLVVDPTGALLAASLECEAGAFFARYGNTQEQLDAEYRAYDAQRRFISLVDDRGDVVATTRVTAPGPAGLKTFQDCAAAPWSVDAVAALERMGVDPLSTWDVTTISVRRGTRRSALASAALFHGLIQTMRANGASATVAILDTRVRALLRTFGLEYRAIAGTTPAEYLGSPASLPVVAPFAAMMAEQRRRMPEAHRLMSMGVGLGDIELPPLSDYVWPRTLDLRDAVTTSQHPGARLVEVGVPAGDPVEHVA